jgi:predicted acylesterase/phospholipase RssA
MTASKKFMTLSFSGAGHLLPYHLGAARVLLKSSSPTKIRAAAGSSSGAIAAAILTLLPHRLEEYADRFLQDRGHAIRNLKDMLEQESKASPTFGSSSMLLVVATTKSSDGSMNLFSFDPQQFPHDPNLIRAVQASCTIPDSFHPLDMFSHQTLSYPDGVEIDGELYCDGGIVAPTPPTPLDEDLNCSMRIVISPISGSSEYGIRPRDDSFSFPGELTARCGTFRIRPSVQNFRAFATSIGVMSSPNELQEWYERGANDAETFLEDVKQRST